MTPMSPCKGCRDRNPGCHDKCEPFQAWKQDDRRLKEAQKEYNRKCREDWMHSEERYAAQAEFAKKKKRGVHIHGK